jgi:hypothetical protein
MGRHTNSNFQARGRLDLSVMIWPKLTFRIYDPQQQHEISIDFEKPRTVLGEV